MGDRPLVALRTTLELRAGESLVQVYIAKVPAIFANEALNILRDIPTAGGVDLQHLRRFARQENLPLHLQHLLSSSNARVGEHVTDLFLLLGTTGSFELSTLQNFIFTTQRHPVAENPVIRSITVPLCAPTSPEQATSWSMNYWPTVYKKSNPFGPHPSILSRAEGEMTSNLQRWISLAVHVAISSKQKGHGEAIGAVIVDRSQGSQAVVLAGDGRWKGQVRGGHGNSMAHATLRAIGMVARKLKAAEVPDYLDPFLDYPLLPEEHVIYDSGQISPDGYLCNGLEIYLTHEPCVMCSMALLHSRFSRVVFGQRMPRTGGLCGESCAVHLQESLGYGLFWRKELNWCFLAWQTNIDRLPAIDPVLHA